MKKLSLLLGALCLGIGASVSHAQMGKTGINLHAVTYYDGSAHFVDIMKNAHVWTVHRTDSSSSHIFSSAEYENGTVALSATGYPHTPGTDFSSGDAGIEKFLTYIVLPKEDVDPSNDKYRPMPTGDYTLIFEGTGEIKLAGGGFATTNVTSSGSYQGAVTRQSGSGYLTLEILATDANDPVRDIRLIMPGHATTYQTQPFRPAFLDYIAPFSALRMMDWSNVNNSIVENWADRTQPDWYSYFGKSRQITDSSGSLGEIGHVPYEVMCQLANQTGKSIWINVPAGADDNYVRQMARLFRDNLDPSIVLYVEWANEIFQFYVAGLAVDRATELWNDSSRADEWKVMRQTEVLAIWNEEFGYSNNENYTDDPSRRYRFVIETPYLNVLAGTSYVDDVKFDYATANFYWGIKFVTQVMINNGWTDGNVTVDFVADRLIEHAMPELQSKLQSNMQAVATFAACHYDLTIATYEGGSHCHDLWFNESVQNQTGEITSQLPRHPVMYEAYMQMFNLLEQEGYTTLNCIFSSASTSGFGHGDYYGEPLEEAPRLRATLDYIASEGWNERFALSDGTTADSGETGWTTDSSAVTGNQQVFSVQNGAFTASDTGGEGVWASEVLDIYGSADISVDLLQSGADNMEGVDYLKVFAVVDGGAEEPLLERFGNFPEGKDQWVTFTAEAIAGDTLQLVIRAKNSYEGEIYRWDNVRILGQPEPTGPVQAIVVIDFWSAFDGFVFSVENNSELASITEMVFKLPGGGLFDAFADTSDFSVSPDLDGNGGAKNASVTLSFAGDGLAAGASSSVGASGNFDLGDIDQNWSTITVDLTFSDGTTFTDVALADLGDADDGDPRLYTATVGDLPACPYFEAEGYDASSATGPWTVVADASAGGGNYMVVPENSGNNSYGTPPEPGYLDFEFELREAGPIYIWLRGMVPASGGGASDSVHIDLLNDGNAAYLWNNWASSDEYDTWVWKEWNSGIAASLPAGTQTLRIHYREDGYRLDRIAISQDPNFEPGSR